MPGVELTVLAREPIMLAMASAHPLARRSRIDLAALGAETMVDFSPGWGIRIANDRAFAAAGLNRVVAYEVNDTGSVVEFIRYGLAVALLPASLVENQDGIQFVALRGRAPEFVTAIATPSNRRPSAAARALLETIQRHAAG